MIDWITAEISLLHEPVSSGRLVKVAPDGEIEFECICHSRVTGSFESSFGVHSQGADEQGKATHLLIDGNPSKFLQGHNVFGSNDLLSLVHHTVIRICSALSLRLSLNEQFLLIRGEYKITRVDINESFELDNLLNVRSWLKAAEFKSKTRHGRPTNKGGTVYWGQNSRRWALKAYCKYDEIHSGKKHRLPQELKDIGIEKWAESKLRIELVLRAKQLVSEGIILAKQLTIQKVKDIYVTYLRRLKMAKNITLTSNKVLELPRKVQSTYLLWTQGYDLKTLLPKPTFYRHRKELLQYDIDINMPCDTPDVTNVVPLLRVLDATPASVPDWAYKQGLVFDTSSFKSINLKIV